MKRIITLLILSLILFSIDALSLETIYYANSSQLIEMAAMRNLDTSGSEDEIRALLYDYYGYDKDSVALSNSKEEDVEYTLNIISAENVSSSESTFTLSGNVVIDFISNDKSTKRLSASNIIIDIERKIITSLGDAKYTDTGDNAQIKEIQADILTVSWEDGNIYITDGLTTTERKNSENKKVNFYTTGERLYYLDEGAIIFDEGYITSNNKTRYSSISASKILILPGEDMFISNARFNIGRVPLFYLPFFFFPGSKILGNPSFGFDSIKGAFLNTSFEIIGTYPKIEETDESSSFSSLLKSTETKGEEVREGYYYSESDRELTGIEKFARSTESYLVLMADSYSGGTKATILKKGGVHLGLDGVFNLFSKKLKINILTGLATPESTIGTSTRYYGNNSLSFSSYGLNISLQFPYYSDRTVLYHYLNRQTGFSYGPLLGGTSTFLSDYSSSISSFTRSFVLTYSLPSSAEIPFVSSFSLKNFSVKGNYYILDTSSLSDEKSVIESYSLPEVSFEMKGTIFSLNSNSNEKNETEEKRSKTEQEENDILLPSLYSLSDTKTKDSSSNSSSSALSLTYSITEDFTNKIKNNTSLDTKSDENITSTTYMRMEMNGNIRNIISLSNSFSSSFVYSYSRDYLKNTWKEKSSINPINTFKLSSQFLSLTYTLSIKPIIYSTEETESKNKAIEQKNFDFTTEFIKTHSLTWSKSFTTNYGTFTGNLEYCLPPLESTLLPSIKWSKNSLSISLSLLFKENSGVFDSDIMKLVLSYSSTYMTLSSNVNYQTKNLFENSDYLSPLSLTSTIRLQNKNKKYYIETSIEGSGEEENFISQIKTSLSLDVINLTVLHKSQSNDKLELDNIFLSTNLKGKSFQFWKGRVYFSFGLESIVFLNQQDKTKSYLTVSPNITMSIAEFIDVKFSLKSQNNRLGEYYDGDKFSFSKMYEDLKRSFDFTGNGRTNTNFILQNITLDVVHYMEDWTLNAEYSTLFVKGSDNGKTVYTLQPSISVYLTWNTMPDLKAQESWSKDVSGVWTRK